MAADERKELEQLSREELLDVFEGGLFELVAEGKELPELAQLTLALGIRSFVDSKISDLDSNEVIDLFLDSEAVVVKLVDHAADQGLLE